MLIIGLTGSIGMGKSTTAGMVRSCGVAVHDSDAVVHALYCGAAVPLIEAAFPGTTGHGEVDRKLLGAKVFSNPSALKQLEALIHPLVTAARAEFLESHLARGTQMVVLDVPLLLETGGAALVDVVLLVRASEAVQRQRVLARPAMTSERLEQILSRQMPDIQKRHHAHGIIDTSLGIASAHRQVRDFLRACRTMTGKQHHARNRS